MNDRLGNHIHDARYRESDNYHKSRWIQKLLANNQRPIIRQIKLCQTREDAEKVESEMITKYLKKHNLVNISRGNGEFTSKGQHSASVYNSKKVYVYNYDGTYFGEFNSHIECSEELEIYVSSIEKCLRGEYKYAKGFQFRNEKFEKIESLEEYSTGSKEVIILDNNTGELLKFKSGVDCSKKLNLRIKASGHKHILGALNKYYGNKYSMLYKGEFIQSTYYNTGVIINCTNNTYKFKSKKDVLTAMGRVCATTLDKFYQYIDEFFGQSDEIKEILLNQPLPLVIEEDN